MKFTILAVTVLTLLATSQSQDPPLSDTRLTVHTLLREDVFSGFLENDLKRFERGEKNIDLLMAKRPEAKSDLLSWKAGTTMYRAILAHEAGKPEEFKQKYQQALDLFAEARKAMPKGSGLDAINGGVYVTLADRLPKEYREAAWSQSYASYQELWKQQGQVIAALPPHFKGEVLGGLTRAALKSGHKQEASQAIDKMIEVLKGTPYESGAKRLKEDPSAIENTKVTCMSCHEDGRLAARLTALDKK
jgi:hypothetical protein